MKSQKLRYWLFLTFVFLFFAVSGFANPDTKVFAQPSCPGSGECSGRTFCNGPCDVVWTPPCNCSCTAQLCSWYDNVCFYGPDDDIRYNAGSCDDDGGDWDPHACPGYTPAGGCDNLYICGGTGILQLDCPTPSGNCINICNAPTSTPASSPPSPTLPPPTPPPPTPGVVPGCTISGPPELDVGEQGIYTANCVDGDGNLSMVRVYSTPLVSPQTWNLNNSCGASGGSGSCNAGITFPVAGSYVVTVNGYDSSSQQCTGNPWCSSWPPAWPGGGDCAASGWRDCYTSPTNVDFITVTVHPPKPPECEIVEGPTSVTASSLLVHTYKAECTDVNNDLTTIELRWDDVNDTAIPRNWTLFKSCSVGGGSADCYGSLSWPNAGTYYVAVNAVDSGNLRCTGNPWCAEWPPAYSPTVSCSSATNDCWLDAGNRDFYTVTVDSACFVDYPDVTLNGPGATQLIAPDAGTLDIPPGRTVFQTGFALDSGVDIVAFTQNPLPGPGLTNEVTSTQPGGPTVYRATTILDDGSPCIDTFSVTVGATPAWWQADGNVTARGGIMSIIPNDTSEKIPPGDPAYLIVDTNGTDPGVLVFNGGLDLGTTGAELSSTNQAVTSQLRYRPNTTFQVLYDKLPADVVGGFNSISASTFDASAALPSGGGAAAAVRGYYVFYYDGTSLGDLTLSVSNPLPDANRVVIFVDNANVTVDSTISPVTRGKSSFLLISEGDISIDPLVGDVLTDRTTPDLEGLFYTDGTFSSGTQNPAEDLSLHIRGAVSAAAFNLERDLGSAVGAKNDLLPGEYFEYGTEQVFAFPAFIQFRPNFWKEEVL